MPALQPPPMPPALPPASFGKRRFATTRTTMALVLREMSTRYGSTPGGYLWGIVEPLAAIMFLSIGFSLVMKSPSLGTSFLLFYATGYMPFNLYQTLAMTVSRALMFSKPLLKYPAVTWVDAILARFLLNSLTGILVTALLLTGILVVIDSRTVLDLVPITQALGVTILLGLGIGSLNCVLIGLFPLWNIVWGILNRPLFLASGVFFLYDTMPPLAQSILWYNPLIHVVGLMRTGFYPTYTAAYINLTYTLAIALISLTLGLILLGRYHREIISR